MQTSRVDETLDLTEVKLSDEVSGAQLDDELLGSDDVRHCKLFIFRLIWNR